MAEGDERHPLFSYLEERFGIPETLFDSFLLFKRRKSWWLLRDSPHLRKSCRLKVSAVGLKAFERVGVFVKPTTRFIQVFGRTATRAIHEVTGEELKTLAGGGSIRMDEGPGNGYVILIFRGRVLGLGLLIEGMIRSQIPRGELRGAEGERENRGM